MPASHLDAAPSPRRKGRTTLLRLPIIRFRGRALSLLELLVVLVIISILATVAAGVYIREVARARYARARAEVATLEVSITRYFVDIGSYPPSGSSANVANNAIGSGWLHKMLRGSANDDFRNPASPRWQGPYVDWDSNRLGDVNGAPITNAATAKEAIHYLDPWGQPYHYINFRQYGTLGGTRLPASDPYAILETYYNPSSFQIWSAGQNGTTLAPGFEGTEPDDVSNFIGSNF